jgi:hypothetical protein
MMRGTVKTKESAGDRKRAWLIEVLLIASVSGTIKSESSGPSTVDHVPHESALRATFRLADEIFQRSRVMVTANTAATRHPSSSIDGVMSQDD